MPVEPAPSGEPVAGPPGPAPLPRFPIGTRIVLFYLVAVVLPGTLVQLGLTWVLGPEALGTAQPQPGGPALTPRQLELVLAIEALTLPLVIAATWLFLRRVDGKRLGQLGVRAPGWLELFAAPLGAGLLLAAWIAVASLGVRFSLAAASTPASAGELARFALGLLAAAALEEWVLRGYVYSTLREGLPWVHGAGIASLLFVLPHAVVGLGAAGLVNVFLLGLVLAAARELSGGLAAPTLFHASWNFLVGSVAGLPISGVRFPSRSLNQAAGPDGWTGGSWGPEGSWVLTVLLLLALVALAALVERRRGVAIPATTSPDSQPDMRK